MKISCQSCPAKYTIADEKVLGKIVKIRCKKCGATIVVNGNEMSPSNDADAGADGDSWTVNVSDGDQRTMSLAEVQTEYAAGTLTDDTYCWKDGMTDWLPIRDIPELSSSLRASAPPPAYDASFAPAAPNYSASMGNFEEDTSATQAMSRNGNGGYGNNNGGFAPGPVAAPAPAPLNLSTPFSPPVAAAPMGAASPAARRAGGRGGSGDLFGGLESAGGEDVLTSAPLSSPPGESKLTGQRNENSVLFSLNALTAKSGAPESENRTTAGDDGSGLIDIRALSASMGSSTSDRNNRVDDIMNLSGGGAFGAALTAPALAPPMMMMASPSAYPEANQKGGGNRGLMIGLIALGVCILLAVGGVGAMFAFRGDSTSAKTEPTSVGMTQPVATGPIAMNDPPPAMTGPAAVAPGVGAATSVPTAMAPNGGPKPVVKPGVADNTPPAVKPAADPPPAASSKPKSLQEALDQAGGGSKPAAAAPAEASAPFDRGAAAAALGAVNVQSCKKPDGPTGSGHVKVTFGPSGAVSSATADAPPFAGTPVGGCVAAKFRGVKIPAFSGGSVSVGKSFTIN